MPRFLIEVPLKVLALTYVTAETAEDARELAVDRSIGIPGDEHTHGVVENLVGDLDETQFTVERLEHEADEEDDT